MSDNNSILVTGASGRPEIATFGAVHLDVTNRDHSLRFWRDVVGLHLRHDGRSMELGTENETLVTLHPVAHNPFRRGHSGLYHLAIHLPDEPEFARVLARLTGRRFPIAAVDHIMSKAIYLQDPDGIGVEFTLETPERFRAYDHAGGRFGVIDSEGRRRGTADPLDIAALISMAPDGDVERPVPAGTKIGHVHLHVGDLDGGYAFYRRLGFVENIIFPRHGFGDLGAGGPFKHRIAVNVWQGRNAPPAPEGTARMRHFTIRFASTASLNAALDHLPEAEEREDGYAVHDLAGNPMVLTVEAES